jgi:hypothetical protein
MVKRYSIAEARDNFTGRARGVAQERSRSLAGPGFLLVSLRFLLDTNVISESARLSPDPRVT